VVREKLTGCVSWKGYIENIKEMLEIMVFDKIMG
jgi:hypothetical protein